ncbi:hypothetical protein AB0M83_46125 [Amycolatopsis sp. NPDC051106]|uniref:hypothetical protein n=1 Tax=unclassified Amycolatopsis TaxID=2618356 RepID=UPI00344A5A61
MSFEGGFAPVEVPAPYSVTVTGGGPVWEVAVTASGAPAGRGLYSALGWRVVSDVVPAHVPEGSE